MCGFTGRTKKKLILRPTHVTLTLYPHFNLYKPLPLGVQPLLHGLSGTVPIPFFGGFSGTPPKRAPPKNRGLLKKGRTHIPVCGERQSPDCGKLNHRPQTKFRIPQTKQIPHCIWHPNSGKFSGIIESKFPRNSSLQLYPAFIEGLSSFRLRR